MAAGAANKGLQWSELESVMADEVEFGRSMASQHQPRPRPWR